jgi:hypothetical protein
MDRLFQYIVLCVGVFVLNSTCVFGATYYLAASGSDNNSCATAQSSRTPKATFASAWGCLTAGDTLIVANGTYTQVSPPAGKAGSAGNMIMIRAANDGGAILAGGLTLRNNSYLEFNGFKITSTGSTVAAFSAGKGLVTHHVTFRRCGFNTTTTTEDGGISLYDGTHHMLFEDFWAWGGGRYTVSCYGGPGGNLPNTTCDFNTFRRGVIRQGPAASSPGNPEASLALYYASNNLVENVIALDGNQDSDSSNAAFYLTAHEPPPQVSGNKFYGVLALNNRGIGWYLDHNGIGSNNELRNSVIWQSAAVGVALYGANAGACRANLVDHITVGKSRGGEGLWNGCDSTTIKSSLFIHNATYGIKQGSSQGSIGAHNWNLLYNNASGAYSNITQGANDKTSNPHLLYIGRVEPGSPCIRGGEGDTNCGADLTFRYQDGVLTGTALWPWPNEARIRKEMCIGAGVTSGFCAAPSLTDYVWGYLGHDNPYRGAPGGALQAPTNLRVTPD